MGVTRLAKAGALALLGLASPNATAQPLALECEELRTIVAAAQEQTPFTSIPRDRPRPMLGFARCSIVELMPGWPAFVCGEDDANSLLRWERLNTFIGQCLPDAEMFDDPRYTPPTPPDRHARFRAGNVLIDTREAGYANVPRRYVALHIEADRE